MNREELEHKIQRFSRLSTQKKCSVDEFREMEGYLKEIRPNWVGCSYCPAQISFGQTILTTELTKLRRQLTLLEVDSPQLQSTISDEEVIPQEPAIEVPVGDVVVSSECQKCKKKKASIPRKPRTKK